LVATHIIAVVLVAARHTGQSQNVKTEYECQNLFHGANVGKNTVGCAENCRLVVVRRDSQTALPKIALSVGLCLSVNGRTVGLLGLLITVFGLAMWRIFSTKVQ